MDDFLEKKPKKHSDAALATAARFSWVVQSSAATRCQFEREAVSASAEQVLDDISNR